MTRTLASDRRLPVLYLRPFDKEAQPFAIPSMRETINGDVVNLGMRWVATFEEYLMIAISKQVGPLVALGNPEDDLPPVGAAREYVRDDKWTVQFEQVSEAAQYILMEVTMSQGLEWELNSLSVRRLGDKLLIFTPPNPKSGWRYYFVQITRCIPHAFYRTYLQHQSWDDFGKFMLTTGFHVMDRDPGPGAILGFSKGCAWVIARDLCDIVDYVEVLVNLQASRKAAAVNV
jgi:hypothetical protein